MIVRFRRTLSRLATMLAALLILLVATFGGNAVWAVPGLWSAIHQPHIEQGQPDQGNDMAPSTRAPPFASHKFTSTGTAFAQTGTLRAFDGPETIGAVYALLHSSNAPKGGFRGPDVDAVPPDQSLYPPGTLSAARVWTKTARMTDAQLPSSGRIRYVPPSNWDGSTPIPRGPNRGYMDRFGNEWTKGPSRTEGQAFEWDVQLSRTGREQIGWATRDGSHANVSLDGRITHR